MEYQDPNHRHRHQQNNRSQEPNHRHNNVNRARAAQQNRRPTPEKDDTSEFATISREGFANMKPMGFKDSMQGQSDYINQVRQQRENFYDNYSIENVTGIKKSMSFADDMKAKSDYYKEHAVGFGGSNSVAQLNTKGDSISVKPELHIGNALNHDDQDRLSKEQQGKNANPEMLYPNKQDNTRVDSFNEKANFIQGQEQKRLDKQAEQAYYQTPEGMAHFVYSGASEDNPNNATVKASNQHHPAVGTDLQKLTHDPVIKGVAAGLPLGYAAEALGVGKLIETNVEKIAANMVKDTFGQYLVQDGDLNEIDFANVIASGFIKNSTVKNLIASTIDLKSKGFDTKKYKDQAGYEKMVQDFIIRQLADKIFKKYKEMAGNQLSKNFNADLVLDVVKKEFRNFTNQKVDKVQERLK